MAKYYIDDEEFGRTYITLRNGMRNVVYRWKQGHLHISFPAYARVNDILLAIEKNRGEIRKLHDKVSQRENDAPQFHVGQVIECYRCRVKIEEQPLSQSARSIKFHYHSDEDVSIALPKGLDTNEPENKRWISQAILRVLERQTYLHIFPLATKLADELGIKPPQFVIFCNSKELFHFSYQRYIENRIRASFGLEGTPVRMVIRQKGDREE